MSYNSDFLFMIMGFAYGISDLWFRMRSTDPGFWGHPSVPCLPLGVRLACPGLHGSAAAGTFRGWRGGLVGRGHSWKKSWNSGPRMRRLKWHCFESTQVSLEFKYLKGSPKNQKREAVLFSPELLPAERGFQFCFTRHLKRQTPRNQFYCLRKWFILWG